MNNLSEWVILLLQLQIFNQRSVNALLSFSFPSNDGLERSHVNFSLPNIKMKRLLFHIKSIHSGKAQATTTFLLV